MVVVAACRVCGANSVADDVRAAHGAGKEKKRKVFFVCFGFCMERIKRRKERGKETFAPRWCSSSSGPGATKTRRPLRTARVRLRLVRGQRLGAVLECVPTAPPFQGRQRRVEEAGPDIPEVRYDPLSKECQLELVGVDVGRRTQDVGGRDGWPHGRGLFPSCPF